MSDFLRRVLDHNEGEAFLGEGKPSGKAATILPAIEVLINANAGTGDKEQVRKSLQETLSEHHISARIHYIRDGRECDSIARKVAAEGDRIIVAAGGDGTINCVASAIIGTSNTLGVLPLGTFNHFAKDLKIPLDIAEAVRNLVIGNTIAVDVGEVNGRIFLNNSSLGIYPRIVKERRKRERHGRGKWPAFLWATLSALKLYPFMRVQLTAEDAELVRKTPLVFIGNNEYEVDGLSLGERLSLNSGWLNVYMTPNTSRIGLAALAVRALFKRVRQAPNFDMFRTKELWVDTRKKRIRVALDGEVTVMHGPLHYRTLPGALRVIAPESHVD